MMGARLFLPFVVFVDVTIAFVRPLTVLPYFRVTQPRQLSSGDFVYGTSSGSESDAEPTDPVDDSDDVDAEKRSVNTGGVTN
jgi:hypothetical protein